MNSVIWPVTVLIILGLFRRQISEFLSSVATVIGKGRELRLKVGGQEFTLFANEIEDLFSDYSPDAKNKINEIKTNHSHYDFSLARTIMRSEQFILPEDFRRGSNQHNTLGAMRQVHLIRNANGGRWHPGHTAEVTTFGRYAAKYLRAELEL